MSLSIAHRTTGELITASIWNTDLVDNINGLANGSVGITTYVVRVKTTTYTAIAGDLVLCSGTFTVTLPAAAGATKPILVVNNGTGTITIGRTSSDTVGLATSQALNPGGASRQGDSMTFVSDGSNWAIL